MFLSDQQIRENNSARDGTNGAGLVTGSGGKTNAKFYWHAQLDGDASQEAGRNIYKEAEYVILWAEGSRDSASHAVTDEDRRNHPEAWAQWQAEKAHAIHPVQYLPGFSAAHRRYCEEAQLFTVEALVGATVYPELQGLQDMGKRWLGLLTAAPAPKKRIRNRKKAPVDVQNA